MNEKQIEANDEIQSILRHSGVFSNHLDRLLRVSSEMWELEWQMMRKTASGVPGIAAVAE